MTAERLSIAGKRQWICGLELRAAVEGFYSADAGILLGLDLDYSYRYRLP